MTSYFDSRAKNYLAKSRKGLWNWCRTRELRAVLEILSPRHGASLIDLGCGAGFYAIPLREQYGMQVLGVDSSAAMLEALKEKCPSLPTDLKRIEDFKTETRYDRVLVAGLLEFMADVEATAALCAKLLKPDGILVLLIPNSGIPGFFYRWSHQLRGCPTYVRPFSFYERIFARHGFVVAGRRRCTPISTVIGFRRPPGSVKVN